MRLKKLTLERMAQMICGASGMSGQFKWTAFPYRSSSLLTRFFHDIELDYAHDGGTRVYWVQDVLEELNRDNASDPRLPSDLLIEVIRYLLDPLHFKHDNCDHEQAVKDLSSILIRENLRVSFVDNEVCLEHLPTGAKPSQSRPQTRPLNPAERKRRGELLKYLRDASEDEFTEHIVVPLFQHLGYSRVTAKGHRDKSLEYGKDLWMKFVIPSDHVIYFGAQIKIGRIHASAGKQTENIAAILTQIKMLFEYPIFDPATNSKHLVDHVYLISSGDITEQARLLISDDLSRSMKRQILFLDQAELLRMWALTTLHLPIQKQPTEDDIPF